MDDTVVGQEVRANDVRCNSVQCNGVAHAGRGGERVVEAGRSRVLLGLEVRIPNGVTEDNLRAR